MRFMLDMDNDKSVCAMDLQEISDVRCVEVYSSDNELPTNVYIELYAPNDTQETCLTGEYNLDGTKETYEKAIQNYTKVNNQLFTKGYAKASDFKNVTWC